MPFSRRRISFLFITAYAVLLVATVSILLPSSIRGAAPPQRSKPAAKVGPTPDLSLEALLEKAAEYCRRLESSAFDFVCREEISETIDPTLDARVGDSSPAPPVGKYSGPTVFLRRVRKIKHSYVYDYQCVRAGRTIREVRTQLKQDGKKRVVPNADLATSVVVFGNALLAPVNLFSDRFRPGYDFTIAGEEKIGKARVLVIDAQPKPRALPTLYGKAWVDPARGDILRIEWSENRVGHFDIFEERGKLFKRTPRLVILSDFSAEKNGIRFPSRLVVEEAYLKESGKAFVRSKTEVVYKDFKFFTVEFEVGK